MSNNIINNDEIANLKNTIKLIQHDIDNNLSDHENEIMILNKYPEIYDKYTFIIKKICKKDNIDILFNMMDILNNVNDGQVDFSHAEKKLGYELANKFLYKKS